jgi:hypothetical protein
MQHLPGGSEIGNSSYVVTFPSQAAGRPVNTGDFRRLLAARSSDRCGMPCCGRRKIGIETSGDKTDEGTALGCDFKPVIAPFAQRIALHCRQAFRLHHDLASRSAETAQGFVARKAEIAHQFFDHPPADAVVVR